jgi:hypothetical protein
LDPPPYFLANTTYKVAFMAKAQFSPPSTSVPILVSIGNLSQQVDITSTVQQFGPFPFLSSADGLGLQLEFQSALENAPSAETIWFDRVEVYSELDR